jgi:hypothetical protein
VAITHNPLLLIIAIIMHREKNMLSRIYIGPVLGLWLVVNLSAATSSEVLRNDKVKVLEYKLAPAEAVKVGGDSPAVTVYFSGQSAEFIPDGGSASALTVKRGGTIYAPVQAGTIKNTGRTELHFVRVEFATNGQAETWGATGLAPNYKLLLENRYGRVYDIRIPAGAREPQHTHHARVVVCLSGAELKHLMPDGREEPSSLKTGEVAWRGAATHIGQNLGKTDLWVIAIEPK